MNIKNFFYLKKKLVSWIIIKKQETFNYKNYDM